MDHGIFLMFSIPGPGYVHCGRSFLPPRPLACAGRVSMRGGILRISRKQRGPPPLFRQSGLGFPLQRVFASCPANLWRRRRAIEDEPNACAKRSSPPRTKRSHHRVALCPRVVFSEEARSIRPRQAVPESRRWIHRWTSAHSHLHPSIPHGVDLRRVGRKLGRRQP